MDAAEIPHSSDGAENRPEHLSAGSTGMARPEALSIGERLRAARFAARLTQQELAGNLFSKSYISAIERDKMTPSLQALSVLAERLDVPVSYLLGESELDLDTLTRQGAPSLSSRQRRATLEEGAMLMLSKAEALIRQDQPRQALEELGESDEPPQELPARHHPVWYWLAGWTSTLTGRHQDAIRLLERGLRLAESLRVQAPRDQQASLAQLVERLRCFLGVAYSANGQMEVALKYHRQGLAAIAEHTITDPELKLMIYKGLGNEYLTLSHYQEAINFYQEAIKQADNMDNERQRGLMYWGLGIAYQQSGDLFRAKTNYLRALDTLGVMENLRLVAQVRALLGEVLTKLGEYEKAESQLRKSLEGAERFNDLRAWGNALANLAALHLARGNPDEAIRTANEGLQRAGQSKDPQTTGQLHLTLAAAHTARHDNSAAEQELKQAIEILKPTQLLLLLDQAHEHYGRFLVEQGRFQEAYEQMRQARTIITRRA